MTVRATCLDVEKGKNPHASEGCNIPQGPGRTWTKWYCLASIVIVQVFASTYPVLHSEEWYQAFYVVAAVIVLVICAGVVSTSMRRQCHDRLEKTLEYYLLTKWAVCISFAAHTGFLWFIPHEVLRNVVGLLPDLLQVFSEYLLYSIWAQLIYPHLHHASPGITPNPENFLKILWDYRVIHGYPLLHRPNDPSTCPEACFKTVYTSWKQLGAVPLALFSLAM